MDVAEVDFADSYELQRRFEVSEDDEKKIIKWLEEVVFPPIIEEQLADPKMEARCRKYGVYRDGKLVGPYLGTVNIGPTYCFTSTAVGDCFVVKFGQHQLDLTDHESW